MKNKIEVSDKKDKLLTRLKSIIYDKSLINGNDVVIYQLNESDGSLHQLSLAEGIPSDKNYLNNMLREGNQLFDSLLEIEEEL